MGEMNFAFVSLKLFYGGVIFMDRKFPRKFLYRRILVMILVVSVMYSGYFVYSRFDNAIPDQICVFSDEPDSYDVHLPFGATVKKPQSTEASIQRNSDYTLQCKLFGCINFKSIQVNVIDVKEVIPCGFQAGLYLSSKGVMIVDVTNVLGSDGLNYEPSLGKLQEGDYIVKVNDIPITGKDQLTFLVNKYGENPFSMTIIRNEKVINLQVSAVLDKDYVYRLGIWVKDDLQGIGTITYLTQEQAFGTLGHGISESDTGQLMDTDNGRLYRAYIWGIKKGASGSPGGLCGVIHYGEENILGEITSNTGNGVFGVANSEMLKMCQDLSYMEVGLKQEIQKGKAYIRCDVNGCIRDYEVRITDININDTTNKGIVLEVVDNDLIECTNGIVQGMSGSPIIQNGKIIGAVTHVFIKDSKKGYGIFIENMLASQK